MAVMLWSPGIMYSALASEMGVADGFTEPVNSGILNAESITFNLGLLLRQLQARMQRPSVS
jgi:hypothetical protein